MNTPNTTEQSTYFPPLLVFSIALCTFTLAFNADEFIGFQSRFGLFAQEMLRNGTSFFPTAYNIPYPDYPAGSILIIWLLSLFSGGLTPFTAILPTMIVSSLILMFVYKIGLLHNQRLGFIAVAMTLLSVGFWQESRTITLDQYVSLISVFTFYILYKQKFAAEKSVWWIWILLWSCSFFIRGPIGVVVPCAVACSFYLLEWRWKDLILTGIIGLGLISLWGYLLLQAGIFQGGDAFLNEILRMQVASRVEGLSISSFLHYFWKSLGNYGLLYPLCAIIVVFSYRSWWNKNTDPFTQLMRFSLAWALIILCGFSLATGKKSHYLLPMIPALGLFAASAWINPCSNPALDRICKLFNSLFYYLPLIAGLALGLFWLYQRAFPLDVFPHALPAHYLFACLSLFTLYNLLPYIKSVDKNLYAAVFTLGIASIFVMEPLEFYNNRTADFVHKIEEGRQHDHAQLAFYKIYPDGLAIKYKVQLDADLQNNHTKEQPFSPQFFYDWALVEKSTTPLWIIIKREVWEEELNAEQKAICQNTLEGNLGHNDVTICKRNPAH